MFFPLEAQNDYLFYTGHPLEQIRVSGHDLHMYYFKTAKKHDDLKPNLFSFSEWGNLLLKFLILSVRKVFGFFFMCHVFLQKLQNRREKWQAQHWFIMRN